MKMIRFLKNTYFLVQQKNILFNVCRGSLPFLVMMISWAASAQTETDKRAFPNDYPVLHPQFRKWPSPALNNEANSVSPILLWSLTKKASGYDIRLSQDPSFADAQTVTEQNIPWTIYNPHRKLNEGTWYWQYRVHNGDWSQRLQFRITPNADQDFAPGIEKFFSAIPASHPRVLVDKSNEKLFAEQNKVTEDGTAILKEVNIWMTKEPPTEKDAERKIEGNSKEENDKIALVASEHASNNIYFAVDLFCKAYILTGGNNFKQKAIAWAMSVAAWIRVASVT